jgi:hypothetical protein
MRLFHHRYCQDLLQEHILGKQGNVLNSSQDPQQERFKSWLDRVVQICEGSTKETSYSLDKILVIRRAMILADFLNQS